MGEIVIRTTHRVQRIDPERSRVTYRMEISGARSGQSRAPDRSRDQRRLSADARRIDRAPSLQELEKRRVVAADFELSRGAASVLSAGA
jgi:hypothetical protein